MLHSLPESDQILLKYSQNETVNHPSQIRHPVLKAVLEEKELKSVDISISSDIPAGTGLGSSSAFTVGLIHTLLQLEGKHIDKSKIAELACAIEIGKLGEPIGKQDQYASALGGINHLVFLNNGGVETRKLRDRNTLTHIARNNLVLIRVGGTRSASSELQIQASNHAIGNSSLLHGMKDILTNFLKDNHPTPRTLGEAIHESWLIKKKFSNTVTNPLIDKLYSKYMNLGAFGGKILGAGGSGFLLLVVPDGMAADINGNHEEISFIPEIDYEGTHLIHRSEA